MTYQTTKLTDLNEVIFTRSNSRVDFANYPSNVQVSCSNLGAGNFDVFILPCGESDFKSHILGASELDTVMIAGKDAPLFDKVKIVFNGAITPVTATLTAWERGI
jgi:hypothetical protein